jgi:uncharacterized protein YyaL (SSP411 family)
MPNRLAGETSPYLLQHEDNPVDWYPWGPEAFSEAERTGKPLLISVGYSACHWCHVMAHESFEDAGTARIMNDRFVNVKVDREERPDVDATYMKAVQTMTGRGGWPMTVFATPDGRPFFAGTYFPKDDRHGMPSFQRVLASVHDAWINRREEILSQADKVTGAISQSLGTVPETIEPVTVAAAYGQIVGQVDWEHGGFGGAPKFPQVPSLEFLLRVQGESWAPQAEQALRLTLDRMADGGIYDHLAGGFARYATDRIWLVPHFEKMLYDNALLARLYLWAAKELGDERYMLVAQETLDYMLSALAADGGGLAAAEDADSEGVEGKFYVWSFAEFQEVCGDDAEAAAARWGVTEEGNFEGANILHGARSLEKAAARVGMGPDEVAAAVTRSRAALLERRNTRIRPGLDDKVITAWNGLALRALAEAGAVLGEPRYLDAAVAVARFTETALRRPDGRLLRSYRAGRARVPAFLEDYGAYALGLFALYQATGDEHWFETALGVVSDLHDLFWSGSNYFATGHDADELIERPLDLMDNPSPSGNSLAAEAMSRAALLTGNSVWFERTEAALSGAGTLAARYPSAVGHLLAVAHSWGSSREVAVVGTDRQARDELSAVVYERYRPGTVLARGGAGSSRVPLLQDRPADAPALAYVCERFVCDHPVADAHALRTRLE